MALDRGLVEPCGTSPRGAFALRRRCAVAARPARASLTYISFPSVARYRHASTGELYYVRNVLARLSCRHASSVVSPPLSARGGRLPNCRWNEEAHDIGSSSGAPVSESPAMWRITGNDSMCGWGDAGPKQMWERQRTPARAAASAHLAATEASATALARCWKQGHWEQKRVDEGKIVNWGWGQSCQGCTVIRSNVAKDVRLRRGQGHLAMDAMLRPALEPVMEPAPRWT